MLCLVLWKMLLGVLHPALPGSLRRCSPFVKQPLSECTVSNVKSSPLSHQLRSVAAEVPWKYASRLPPRIVSERKKPPTSPKVKCFAADDFSFLEPYFLGGVDGCCLSCEEIIWIFSSHVLTHIGSRCVPLRQVQIISTGLVGTAAESWSLCSHVIEIGLKRARLYV